MALIHVCLRPGKCFPAMPQASFKLLKMWCGGVVTSRVQHILYFFWFQFVMFTWMSLMAISSKPIKGLGGQMFHHKILKSSTSFETNYHMTALLMWCCHQIWNNLWYFPLCLEVVCHKDESLISELLSFSIEINCYYVCPSLPFLSYPESNGQACCGFECQHLCEMPLPLGDPPTPWLWATEPCCPCVWSAARCSKGKNKNIQDTKIWHDTVYEINDFVKREPVLHLSVFTFLPLLPCD